MKPLRSLETLLALRGREQEARAEALARACGELRAEELVREAARAQREEHRVHVRAEVAGSRERLEAGACTASDLEQLAAFTLGATIKDEAHAREVADRTTRVEASSKYVDAARHELARARVAVRAVEERAKEARRKAERTRENRREEDP